MPAPYTGRCACGAVTLRIKGEALTARQCWCRQCQQIAAGGPTNNAMFRSGDIEIEGELGSCEWHAASGTALTFRFCPSCGTQICAQSSARPEIWAVRLGAIDEPHGLRPRMVIWTDDAPNWAVFDPDLEQWPRQPPAPPPKPA